MELYVTITTVSAARIRIKLRCMSCLYTPVCINYENTVIVFYIFVCIFLVETKCRSCVQINGIIQLSTNLSKVVHKIQLERDQAVLFRNKFGSGSKLSLLKSYKETDKVRDEYRFKSQYGVFVFHHRLVSNFVERSPI